MLCVSELVAGGAALRHAKNRHYLLPTHRVVATIPCIDRFRSSLEGAMREHGVVDSAAHNPESRGSLQCMGIFVARECDDSQPFANAPDK